jgi:serine/threonine protein kinase
VPRPTKLGSHDPTKVGPYTLLARLGQGGQGRVYLAADDDGNRVAVKVLKTDWDDSGTLMRNLDRELVNARKVVQFVTATVLDFDVVGEPPYIVSEYIEGLTLAEHIRENGPLKGSELLQVAVQTLTALEAIHRAGIIHCDFKPANIILGRGGARVIDFGVAQALDSTHRVGRVAGTIPFMAPEQIANKRLTAAVDLFAWGSTMVFAATGQNAFPGGTPEVVAQRILMHAPQLDGTDEPLLTIIRACLKTSPADRPTAAQARRMLLGPRRAPAPESQGPVYAVGVASGPSGSAKPPPNRRPVNVTGASPPPATLFEGRSHRPAPPPNSQPSSRGRWKGWIFISAAAAVVVILAIVWGDPEGTDKTTAKDGPSQHSNPPVPATQDPARTLTDYLGYWPNVDCSWKTAMPGMRTRVGCVVPRAGVTVNLYCVRYDDMTTMAEQGRPGGGRNNIPTSDVSWRNRWYRDDAARHGDFIAYRLDRGNAAIWWEDSASPVACFIHGPEGSHPTLLPTLLAVFREREFKLRDPVPPTG